jgi:protein gp37
MPGATSIEWASRTWNPSTGCGEVSPGCAHCYAKTFAERWRGIPGHPYEQGFDLRLWPERLSLPLRWRKPSVIFVNSMSDLFHEEIPDEFIAQVFAVMSQAPRHIFQVLTKRPERMRALLGTLPFAELVDAGVAALYEDGWESDDAIVPARGLARGLPNVWLGVSIENRRFVHRADVLRDTPAAVRFISAEPLLGPLVSDGFEASLVPTSTRTETPSSGIASRVGRLRQGAREDLNLAGIDWLIVGGESGGHARALRVEWVEALARAAREHGTALFVKQLGARWARAHPSTSTKGADPADWPARLRVRELPGGRALETVTGGGA